GGDGPRLDPPRGRVGLAWRARRAARGLRARPEALSGGRARAARAALLARGVRGRDGATQHGSRVRDRPPADAGGALADELRRLERTRGSAPARRRSFVVS